MLTELVGNRGDRIGEVVEDLDSSLSLTLGGDGVPGDAKGEEREGSDLAEGEHCVESGWLREVKKCRTQRSVAVR